MKIQIIGLSDLIDIQGYECTYSPLHRPKTLDSFDINIINLQIKEMWRNDLGITSCINDTKDLLTIQKLLESSNKTNNIIFLPRNYKFRYQLIRGSNPPKYSQSFVLKDSLECLKTILGDLLPYWIQTTYSDVYDLAYEDSLTKCGNKTAQADFYFSNFPEGTAVTFANDSQKPTTIKTARNCYISTLSLADIYDNFSGFLREVGILEQRENIPQWLVDYMWFDDEEKHKLIDTNNAKINILQQGIDSANKSLEQNLHYKRALIENGQNLVDIVFEILQKMLRSDLSKFTDEKNEDFLVKLSTVSFIGEIKGITSNVKSENLSQVDRHCQNYLEILDEKGETENVKQLLVINYQRNKPLKQREPINEKQIKLAIRNSCLIIPTWNLLDIYEQFLVGKITTETIVEQFTSQTGLIDIEKFKENNNDQL